MTKIFVGVIGAVAWIEKWDGKLPQVSSDAIPMVTIK